MQELKDPFELNYRKLSIHELQYFESEVTYKTKTRILILT